MDIEVKIVFFDKFDRIKSDIVKFVLINVIKKTKQRGFQPTKIKTFNLKCLFY